MLQLTYIMFNLRVTSLFCTTFCRMFHEWIILTLQIILHEVYMLTVILDGNLRNCMTQKSCNLKLSDRLCVLIRFSPMSWSFRGYTNTFDYIHCAYKMYRYQTYISLYFHNTCNIKIYCHVKQNQMYYRIELFMDFFSQNLDIYI